MGGKKDAGGKPKSLAKPTATAHKPSNRERKPPNSTSFVTLTFWVAGLMAGLAGLATWYGSSLAGQAGKAESTSAPKASGGAPSARSSEQPPVATPAVVDTDDAASCLERMEAGDCDADEDGALMAGCRATCLKAPVTARCRGWARRGYCNPDIGVTAFMRVHCPGGCRRDQVVCARQPPADMHNKCPEWAASGRCEKEWQRGNGYFLSQCFQSCGKHDAALLLHAMLATIGNTSLAFPKALVNLPEAVGDVETVQLDADGQCCLPRDGDGGSSGGGGGGSGGAVSGASARTVRIERLNASPKVTAASSPRRLSAPPARAELPTRAAWPRQLSPGSASATPASATASATPASATALTLTPTLTPTLTLT